MISRASQVAACLVAKILCFFAILCVKAGSFVVEATGLEVEARVEMEAYRPRSAPLIFHFDEMPDYPPEVAAYLAESIGSSPPEVAAKLPDLDAPGGPEWSPSRA